MTIYADRVQETTTDTGTGTIALAGAVAGFQSFSVAFPAASTPNVPYSIVDTLGNWETGHGTFTLSGATLTRVPVDSSNSGALVVFPAGTKQVFNTLLAADFAAIAVLALAGAAGVNYVNTSGTYTAVLGDASVNEVQRDNVAANDVTIPHSSSVAFPIGAQIGIRMYGAGQTSVVAAGGVSLVSTESLYLLQTGAFAVAIQTSLDSWQLTGELKPALVYKTLQSLDPANTTVAGTMIGMVISSTATVSHPTQTLTNLLSAIRRIRWATTTTAGNASGFFETVGTKWQGNTPGLGGYNCVFRFGISVNTTGHQCFVGLGPAAVLAGDPSGVLSMVGMGFDAADLSSGNWQFMRNDASGVATRQDLGSGAARNTTDLYKMTLRAPSNGAAIYVTIVNESTKVTVYDTSFSTDIPANTFLLAARAQVRNGALSAAMQVDFVNYDAGMQE